MFQANIRATLTWRFAWDPFRRRLPLCKPTISRLHRDRSASVKVDRSRSSSAIRIVMSSSCAAAIRMSSRVSPATCHRLRRSDIAEERHIGMKIKLDIDSPPDELREFFGLPQLKPLQDELLKEVQERLRANIKAMDPEAMLKT